MQRVAAHIVTLLTLFSIAIVCHAADTLSVDRAETTLTIEADSTIEANSATPIDSDFATLRADSTIEADFATLRADSIEVAQALKMAERERRRNRILTRIPDPEMAAWIAALFPGLGQAYNRQYWKIPILYAGVAGLGYAISWNNQLYVDYRKGYTDITGSDPNAKFYEHLLPSGVVLDGSNKEYYTRIFKTRMDSYQRNRDLSIIGMAALYLLSIIDAYVDSQLRDYDVSPDLSMKVLPTVIPATQDKALDNSLGVSCKLKF